ncbi:hypothetical protein [Halobellus salinisoli]|uniref:hypothetical protein n=1 Tax=Halobellus salinisoli TaxID=3108500 RepID=UPI0030096A5D
MTTETISIELNRDEVIEKYQDEVLSASKYKVETRGSYASRGVRSGGEEAQN